MGPSNDMPNGMTNSPADWSWKKQDDMWQIFCGQYFRQLLRVANSLRSVAARLNAVAGASAIALVFLAQLFVAATATVKKVMRRNCSVKLHFKW